MSTDADTRDALLERAYALGREAGEAVASWYFDGNTTREQYGSVLTGIIEGDPATYDTFPTSPLSGEYAGDPLPADVLIELELEHEDERADDALAMYEDGFGVAVSETIEKQAREGYAGASAEDDTLQSVALEMARRFTQRHRADGTPYITLTDAAAPWMTDVVREAHADMLPDDWRYDAIASAVEFIATEDDAEERADEWCEGQVGMYRSDQSEWLGSHVARAGYVQKARVEWGDAGDDIWEEITRGQYVEAREVWALVVGALEAEAARRS